MPSFDYGVTAKDKKTNWGAAWDLSDIIQANEEEKEESRQCSDSYCTLSRKVKVKSKKVHLTVMLCYGEK